MQVAPRRPGGEFDAKLSFLLTMYDTLTVGKTIIFVETKRSAEALAEAMKRSGHSPALLTGAKKAPALFGPRVLACTLPCS